LTLVWCDLSQLDGVAGRKILDIQPTQGETDHAGPHPFLHQGRHKNPAVAPGVGWPRWPPFQEIFQIVIMGLLPTAQQVSANMQAIEANRQGVAANKVQLAAHKGAIETNQ